MVVAVLTPQKTTTKVTLPNGDRYEGEAIGIMRTGVGTYTFANGDRYEGEFADNFFHGKGTQTYVSGDVYTGDFQRSVKTGQGIYRYANGDRFEGGFIDNVFHGKGRHTFKSGDSFEGEFNRGIKQGPGTYRFANGDRFDGNFVDNQFNGRGVMIFANGDRYEGEFRNNVKDGKGVHFFASKDRYEGTFQGGLQAGTGTHFSLGKPGDPTGPVTNEDYASALVEFENGALGTFESCRVIFGPKCEMAWEINGTKGAISWNFERMNELNVYFPDGDGVHDGYARILTAPDMSVPGHPGLWALGDCACVPNALDGSTSPPTAQFAVQQARRLASNLVARLAGQTTQPFRYRSRGMMASIGHLKGVAEVAGVPLTGWPAWLVWRAYYLMQMPSFGRKLRIFFEWGWGMFFPPDITHLRFTRSHELKADEARRQREHVAMVEANEVQAAKQAKVA